MCCQKKEWNIEIYLLWRHRHQLFTSLKLLEYYKHFLDDISQIQFYSLYSFINLSQRDVVLITLTRMFPVNHILFIKHSPTDLLWKLIDHNNSSVTTKETRSVRATCMSTLSFFISYVSRVPNRLKHIEHMSGVFTSGLFLWWEKCVILMEV